MSRASRSLIPKSPARTLASVRRDLTRWRKAPGRTWRIPEALWEAAAALASELGVAQVSRELRLDYYALQKRARSRAVSTTGTSTSSSGAFVELSLPTPVASTASEHSVELADERGVRLRVELRGVLALRARWHGSGWLVARTVARPDDVAR